MDSRKGCPLCHFLEPKATEWVWETLLPVMRLATQYENGQPERLSIVFLYWVGESNSYCEIENLEY